MALRVLLADESPTIKKVIQLALQDYSVEVKAVPVGIDVIPIAKVFQPDVIFVDVLLVKKSGYDVAKDIKKDSELTHIPVVLLWNSLMGIDEGKAVASLANRRLEKPFEVETLRSIIQELVPKTINHPVSSFLNFDEIDSIRNYKKDPPQNQQNFTPPKIPNFNIPFQANDYVLDESVMPDDFAHVPLHKAMPLPMPSLDDNPQINAADGPNEELIRAKHKASDNFEEIVFTDAEVEAADDLGMGMPKSQSEFSVPLLSNIPLDAKTQEKIFREEVRVIAEKICWSLLPDITERVVREEIKKLLQES